MPQRIDIQDATAEQLRQFGEMSLGLELSGRETRDQMAAKFAEAGYSGAVINLPDPAPVPSGGPNREGAAFHTRINDETGETEVRITIHTQDKPGGEEPVPVGVNGRMILIPRGEPVWVAQKYVEVLDHAVEYVYQEYDPEVDGGLGGLKTPRTVKSYPFSYA